MKKNPRGFALYIDVCQHTLARTAWILLRTEHVAIHGVPYELPDQNSSPNIPSGSQDSYLLQGAKKRYVKCENAR